MSKNSPSLQKRLRRGILEILEIKIDVRAKIQIEQFITENLKDYKRRLHTPELSKLLEIKKEEARIAKERKILKEEKK